MPDFRDYDDVIWASASATLGLTLYDEAGNVVAPRDGNRAHVMRGRLSDLSTTVRGPRTLGTDRCIVEVELAYPLMLGLRWRYGGELAELRPPLFAHFSVDAIEAARATRLATKTRASAHIEDAIRGLGLVHAAMDDTTVKIARVGSPEGPSYYVETVRVAERVARLIAEARAEIGDADWERVAQAELDRVASTFGLDADARAFAVRGPVGGAELDLSIQAAPARFEIAATLAGRGSPSLVIETRASRRGHAIHDFFHRRATGDPAFDRAFAVDADAETIARRCTPEARAGILALGADVLRYDATGLSIVVGLAPFLEDAEPARGGVARLVERMRSILLALGGATPSSPYR